jgi:hypothetical protein
MILHFSHIGLTEGRTFTLNHALLAGNSVSVDSSPGLWRPFRSPLPRRSDGAQRLIGTLKPQRGMLATPDFRPSGRRAM